jgi:diketogulonate reductase-like aldo/keto reductase
MDIFDFELTEEEMQKLKALGKPESAAGLPAPFMYA